jgi:hypothetical protein
MIIGGGEMRRLFLAALLVFGFTLAYAKDDPIPDALLNAKTAIVQNSGAEKPDVDKLIEALQKWGRWEILPLTQKTDLRIALTREMKEQMVNGPGGRMQNLQVLINHINIYKTDDDTLLWSDKTSTYSKDPKALVNNLKNRLKSK